jgi:hypothetical protein
MARRQWAWEREPAVQWNRRVHAGAWEGLSLAATDSVFLCYPSLVSPAQVQAWSMKGAGAVRISGMASLFVEGEGEVRVGEHRGAKKGKWVLWFKYVSQKLRVGNQTEARVPRSGLMGTLCRWITVDYKRAGGHKSYLSLKFSLVLFLPFCHRLTQPKALTTWQTLDLGLPSIQNREPINFSSL